MAYSSYQLQSGVYGCQRMECDCSNENVSQDCCPQCFKKGIIIIHVHVYIYIYLYVYVYMYMYMYMYMYIYVYMYMYMYIY